MKRVTLLSLVASALLFACHGDQPVALKPPGISAAILDGAHGGGNGHFFFLPPLVQPVWPPPTFPGVFNPRLTPVATVCVLDVTTHLCGATLQTFPTLTAPSGGDALAIDPSHLFDRIQVVPQAQLYFAFWNAASAPGIPYFRVTVTDPFTHGQLGFVDVKVVGSFAEALQVWQAGQFAPLLSGAPLAIVFRIEQGALGSSCTSDCAEQVVTNDGGTVVTVHGFAGAQFPQGWLPPPFTSVLVKIDRVVSTTPCIPGLSEAPQFQGCYRYTTSPTVGPFAKDVTVGICHVFVPQPGHDAIQLYSFEEVEGGRTTALPNTPASFLTCANFASTAPPGGGLRNLASRLFHQVEALVAPTSAYAGHLGDGGLICCFSRVGWALPIINSMIDFDHGPTGRAVPAGTVVDTAYIAVLSPTEGVTFSRTQANATCGDTHVYANDHGPKNGAFGFNSGQNVVTVCPEGTASDFSENAFGRIRARFTPSLLASQVCIQVWTTGQPGAVGVSQGFLEAFNATGGSLGKAFSNSDANAYGQTICVTAPSIASVEFAGSQAGFAIFDNFSFLKQ
jgi:hypothetical protein